MKIVFHFFLSLSLTASFLALPSEEAAAGTESFYRCTRSDGTLVITNREQGADFVTCIPFAVNRDFKAAEERRRTELPLMHAENELEASEAARMAAEAAYMSANAARSAAAAAREAADAAAFVEAPPPVVLCPSEYRDWRRR